MRLIVSTIVLICVARLPTSFTVAADCAMEPRTRLRPSIDWLTASPPSSAARVTRCAIAFASAISVETPRIDRSSCVALVAALSTDFEMTSAFCATPSTERAVSSTEVAT
jgi:hypothetical protein